jgi:hypothetical protein
MYISDTGDSLEGLGGGVGHVVSPNYEHLKYAKQWAEVYPAAKKHGMIYECIHIYGFAHICVMVCRYNVICVIL